VACTTGANDDEKRARTLVEKKTVLNLVEGFAVSVKHYLRGEEGIRYEDLYHLTKYLPAYALPAGKPRNFVHEDDDDDDMPRVSEKTSQATATGLPPPVTSPRARMFKMSVGPDGGPPLLPSRNPPKFSIFDIFPFTMLVKPLTKRGVKLGGKTAQKARAKMGYGRSDDVNDVISHNIPLEVSLYLVSYRCLSFRLVIIVLT
jgi:putative membrane protein